MKKLLTILVLDDSEERLVFFRRWLQREGEVVCVEHAQGAIDALRGRTFDLVFLDHDLGTGCETGDEVAKFICTMASPPEQVIVHSANVVGAARMVARLTQAGVHVGERNIGRLMGRYVE